MSNTRIKVLTHRSPRRDWHSQRHGKENTAISWAIFSPSTAYTNLPWYVSQILVSKRSFLLTQKGVNNMIRIFLDKPTGIHQHLVQQDWFYRPYYKLDQSIHRPHQYQDRRSILVPAAELLFRRSDDLSLHSGSASRAFKILQGRFSSVFLKQHHLVPGPPHGPLFLELCLAYETELAGRIQVHEYVLGITASIRFWTALLTFLHNSIDPLSRIH